MAPPSSAGELDDADLARAAAAGDRYAFGVIYDRYADRLHDFCIAMLRDRDAAADCVQDVFVTAATKLVQLRDHDRLRSWLYAIARNEALARIRDRRRERPSEELPEMVSREPDPATLAARCELADLISEASGGLSDRDRTVLELAYRQGLDGLELADALGVTHKNANTLVERLRETIGRSLGALLVCRRVKGDPKRCPEMAGLIDEWDGQFTVLLRKRAARHIDSCAVCEEERARMVHPAALLGAAPLVIPAPTWLRAHTLAQMPVAGPPPTAAADSPADIESSAPHAPATHRESAYDMSESWWPESDFNTDDLSGSVTDEAHGARLMTASGRKTARSTRRASAHPERSLVRAVVGGGLLALGIAGGVLLATSVSYRIIPTDAPGGPATPVNTLPTSPFVDNPAPTTTTGPTTPATTTAPTTPSSSTPLPTSTVPTSGAVPSGGTPRPTPTRTTQRPSSPAPPKPAVGPPIPSVVQDVGPTSEQPVPTKPTLDPDIKPPPPKDVSPSTCPPDGTCLPKPPVFS
jgi:RNA polymerase sigma factor (sigma-70 family)